MSFQAKYPGICGFCGERFSEGAEIRSTEDDGWVHAPTCPDPEDEPDLVTAGHGGRCPDCNLHHRGECF